MAFSIYNALFALTVNGRLPNGSSVQINPGTNRVIVSGYPISLTTQRVNDRLVVDGRQVSYVAGNAPIQDLTQLPAQYTFTLINAAESYPVTWPDASLRANTVTVPWVVPGGRNMTDHFVAQRVVAAVDTFYGSTTAAGGAFSRINFPAAQTADFNGMALDMPTAIWTTVATSAYGVSPGNIRIPLLADDQPTDHFVDRNVDGVVDDLNGNGVPTAKAVAGDANLWPLGDEVPGLTTKIQNAINSVLNTGTHPISARALGKYVRLDRGSVTNASGLIADGAGPVARSRAWPR